MKNLLTRIVNAVVGIYRAYPARSISLVVSGIVTVCGLAGVVVSPQSVQSVIEVIVPILLTGELTHQRVSPAKR